MKIKKVTLHLIGLTLVTPFVSSIGTVKERESILVEIEDEDGRIGWGEVVAFSSPWYTEETIKTCWHMIEDFIAPIVLSMTFDHPSQFAEEISYKLKRNNMAKAAIEGALWDIYAQRKGISLATALGGTKKNIESGVVVGMGSMETVLKTIGAYVNEGYKRVKVKIEPGKDLEVIKVIRQTFPHLPLMADANSAYSLNLVKNLQALDQFGLLMIEQPLESDDIIDHAKLQKELQTPICLDESITSYDDARKAIELGSCKVINIKSGRVGGLTEAVKIHDLCLNHHVPVWCGGMLETGISRAQNIALASLENFTIPGDISASSRYWEQDVIIPEVQVQGGKIEVPTEIGLGYKVNRQFLEQITKSKKSF
ncbi:o-succinylbenzoate synthase [Bacillus timonensis]|nr:o-succinylbenzoate synthase [Bacillus timonensis]